ncbi:TPA: GNAT family N-acetyltransferase [Streptococcus suis]|nr:GNAT family N-acetyltransferase [Streptococcus suis]
MAITGIEQADILEIDKQVRLRRYDGQHDFAFEWHQDLELVWLVDGNKEPYTLDRLNRMYGYLATNGECYFIEILENGQFLPIGDVTLLRDDFAISIGDKRYWQKGVGSKVLQRMVDRARELGFVEILVEEIYDWNLGSRKLFEKCGFEVVEKTKKGCSYKKML